MSVGTVVRKARSVRDASRALYTLSTQRKNELLGSIAALLQREASAILRANGKDLNSARKNKLSGVLLDRLTLDEKRIGQMIGGIEDVIALPDPVGQICGVVERPNGLIIQKVRVPLGAVGIIYEARPNVTIDASVLCLKSGNTVLLRGGSEAFQTNRKLVDIIHLALKEVGLPRGCVEFIDTTDRKAVRQMLKQADSLDVIIPRGSQKLIRYIRELSTVPVIAHGEGNCHIYIDDSADLTMRSISCSMLKSSGRRYAMPPRNSWCMKASRTCSCPSSSIVSEGRV